MIKLIQKISQKFGYNFVELNEIPGDIIEKERLKILFQVKYQTKFPYYILIPIDMNQRIMN